MTKRGGDAVQDGAGGTVAESRKWRVTGQYALHTGDFVENGMRLREGEGWEAKTWALNFI